MEEFRDKHYEEKVITIDRVSRTVKGGKRISFRALLIVGDKQSKVGIGIGKGAEVAIAIRKASTKAKKQMIEIKTNENGSIKKEVLAKLGSATILLKPAPEGTSIIAGGVVRAVAELAGIKNLVAKSYGTNNKINIAKAVLKGLIEAGENGNTN
jgi:small subunit ribosomal protein S5